MGVVGALWGACEGFISSTKQSARLHLSFVLECASDSSKGESESKNGGVPGRNKVNEPTNQIKTILGRLSARSKLVEGWECGKGR